MTYKRFFAFGCSLTNYYWPTWADIIGRDIEFYQNWGVPGAGNHYIFNSIVEANTRYKFNNDDLVIVMWSTMHREDRYKNNRWVDIRGRVSEEIEIELYDQRGFMIRDLAYITSAIDYLRNTNSRFTAMNVFWHGDHYGSKPFKEASKNIWKGLPFDHTQVYQPDVLEFYQDTLTKLHPSVCETILDFDWNNTKFKKKIDDYHPIPNEYLEFVNKAWPDIKVSKDTQQWVIEESNKVLELTEIKSGLLNTITDRL